MADFNLLALLDAVHDDPRPLYQTTIAGDASREEVLTALAPYPHFEYAMWRHAHGWLVLTSCPLPGANRFEGVGKVVAVYTAGRDPELRQPPAALSEAWARVAYPEKEVANGRDRG